MTDDQDKATVLNDFFSSVFTDESFHDFPQSPEGQSDNIKNHLCDVDITLDKITKLISKLKESKAAGPDGIHARVLK